MLRRGLELVATAAVAVSLTFLFFQYTIEGVTAPADLLAALGRWFERLVLHLDLGESFLGSEVPVSRVLREGLAVDMTLLIGGTLAALAWALPLGAWAGAHPRSRRARTFHTGASAVLSSPVYWLGFVVLILFANDSGRIAQLSFVSGQGDYADLGGNPLDWGRAVWVPILVREDRDPDGPPPPSSGVAAEVGVCAADRDERELGDRPESSAKRIRTTKPSQ